MTVTVIDYKKAKGWLKAGETELLHDLAKSLPASAVILNIGVEYGKSLACLRAGNAEAHIIGLDLDITKAVSTYGCELIQQNSHEAFEGWETPLDLVFVDGDHGKLGVLLDARFSEFVKVGGYILFQDVFDWDEPGAIHKVCPGVYEAVEEWANRPATKQEFEELPSVDTTRVFKRVKARVRHDSATATEVTRSSSPDSNVQPGRTAQPEPKANGGKSQIRGRNQGTGKRR